MVKYFISNIRREASRKREIESLLNEAKIARFCSLNEDGTIHATPVWFRYENGKVVILTPNRNRKARNAKLNKNVTILIEVEGPRPEAS